jgi:beta-lactamase class A
MKQTVVFLFMLSLSLLKISAADTLAGSKEIMRSEAAEKIVASAARGTLDKFKGKGLTEDQLAVTLVDLRDVSKPVAGSFRGDERIYPASVVKLFYLVAIHRWMEEGKAQDTPELRRAMRDMIVESYNEATGLVLDTLTDTTSGPELPLPELDKWFEKRNAVNRYFASLGYTNINACRKPWCEGPYGREMQSTKVHTNAARNALTTDATARLMAEIALHKAGTAERCDQMLELLSRDPFNTHTSLNGQARGFTGMALPGGSKLWSKAGWTSDTRHDAAYVELPTGEKFVLVTFTTNHPNEREIIAEVARRVIQSIQKKS